MMKNGPQEGCETEWITGRMSVSPKDPITPPMDRAAAIEEIRNACNSLSSGVTGLHKLVPALSDQPTQDEIFKALFELTKNIEVVKKQLLKLQRRDDSAAL